MYVIDFIWILLYNESTLFLEYQLPCLINQYALARLGYGEESMADINVQDCDQCLNPYWEDQLKNGLCPTCGENDLASFFE